MTADLIVLTSALKKWYSFLSPENNDDDYISKMKEMISTLRTASNWLSLSSMEFNELHADGEQLLDCVIELFCTAVVTCPSYFEQDHWDFILCSLLSWLQV